jgi:hypothetical protein
MPKLPGTHDESKPSVQTNLLDRLAGHGPAERHSIGAVQEAAQSTVPVIGYTIPYAVNRTVLALAGIAMLLVMK